MRVSKGSRRRMIELGVSLLALVSASASASTSTTSTADAQADGAAAPPAGATAAAPSAEPGKATPPEAQVGLEDIIVTAQRREENLQRVPIAITAITAAGLETSGVNSVTQLERTTPSLKVYQVAGAAVPFLRGVGSSQSTIGFESPIAIYIDGVYQGAKTGNIFDLPDLERIEVLKGPQGTLFGRNATGGAINIITRVPDQELTVRAEAGYGRFNEKRAKLYVGGGITDTLRVGVALSGRWDDGYIYNTFRGVKQDPAKYMVASGKIVWDPTDRFSATLSGSYNYTSDATGLSPHLVAGTVPAAAARGFAPNFDNYTTTSDHKTYIINEAQRYTLNASYKLEGVRLVSITGYIKGNNPSLSESDSSQGLLNFSGSINTYNQFSQELQLQSTGSGRLQYILGAYYMDLNDGWSPGKNLISAANLPSPLRPADLLVAGASASGFDVMTNTKAYSAFGQATYEIFASTHLTLGARYNTEKKSIDGTLFRYAALPAAGNTGVKVFDGILGPEPLVFGKTVLATMNLSKTFSKPTFRISLDHQISPDMMVYASYNRGFKSGAYAPTTVSSTQVPVNPEVLDAWEVGFKGDLIDRRLRVNLAGYYYNYKDLQVALITGPGLSTVQNAAGGHIKGFDADITALPFDNLTLRAAVNFTDSKYIGYPNSQVFLQKTSTAACPAPPPAITYAQALALTNAPVPAGVGGNCSYSLNVSGMDLIFSPKWTGSISADYGIPMGESRVALTGSLYFNSGFDIVPAGFDAHVGAYETLTAGITYYGPGDRYFIRVWGDNLTNDHHPIYISPQAAGFQEVNARPITYGMTIGFKFGR